MDTKEREKLLQRIVDLSSVADEAMKRMSGEEEWESPSAVERLGMLQVVSQQVALAGLGGMTERMGQDRHILAPGSPGTTVSVALQDLSNLRLIPLPDMLAECAVSVARQIAPDNHAFQSVRDAFLAEASAASLDPEAVQRVTEFLVAAPSGMRMLVLLMAARPDMRIDLGGLPTPAVGGASEQKERPCGD